LFIVGWCSRFGRHAADAGESPGVFRSRESFIFSNTNRKRCNVSAAQNPSLSRCVCALYPNSSRVRRYQGFSSNTWYQGLSSNSAGSRTHTISLTTKLKARVIITPKAHVASGKEEAHQFRTVKSHGCHVLTSHGATVHTPQAWQSACTGGHECYNALS